MRKYWSWSAALFLALSVSTHAAVNINFRTFVSSSSIANAEGGNHATIAFNFAGNKFVGSVYSGIDNNQLYSTDLTGGGVTQFGQPIPGASAEVVVGAALGVNQGSWIPGDIYAGSEANGQIYHFASTGGAPTLFATVPSGVVRQIFFDPGSSFQGNMLVTTKPNGNIYQITQNGNISLLASVGEDTEGMDIATSAWGPYAGFLLVGSEVSGTIRLISPSGQITPVLSTGSFPGAETISFVPLNLDANDPSQGFYVANYPNDIQFAPASNFTGLLGDAIVTDETGGSTAWDVHYNSATGTFTKTQFTFTGNQITQFEDGIFVTSQREASEPGYLEICKASDPAYPVMGLFTFTATIFTFSSGPIMVPVGDCSGAVQVPSGTVTITETPTLGVLVDNVTAYSYNILGQYVDELLGWTEPDLNATVGVQPGDVSLGTVATFTNYMVQNDGQLKICKIAGQPGALNQSFTFTVTDPLGQQQYMIQAGPPDQGGYCVLADQFQVNTQVTIAETPNSSFPLSNIAVQCDGCTYTTNLAQYNVVTTIGAGITEVDFTNVATPTCSGNNLLTNGSFETGDFTGWTTGGNFTNTDVVSGPFYRYSGAESGTYYAVLGPVGSDGTLTQTFATNPGQSYTVCFWLSAVGDNPSDFNAFWDGTQFLSLTNPNTGGGGFVGIWKQFVYGPFTGTGSDTLTFGFRDDPNYIALDNVQVSDPHPRPRP